jgi:hypothetical protein
VLRQLPIAGSALLAAATLAACGGQTLSIDPIAKAADKTDAAPPAHFTMAATIEGQGGITFTGSGVVTGHGNTMDMHMHVPKQPGNDPFDAEVVQLEGDSTIYMKAAVFADGMPKGKHWVAIAQNDPFGDFSQNDPAQMLQYLRGAGSVDEVGTEDVRGVSTKHYKATIDLHKVADRLSGSKRKLVEQAAQVLGEAGSKVPLEVWVGDDGYVHRIHMDWRVQNPQQPSDRFALTMDMDLFDFGTQDTIPHPAEAETIPLKTVLERIRNGG